MVNRTAGSGFWFRFRVAVIEGEVTEGISMKKRGMKRYLTPKGTCDQPKASHKYKRSHINQAPQGF